MVKNILKKPLNWIAKSFSENPSKMLIWTGVIGWTTSSLAQIGAILFNPKLKNEQKSFLIPQETWDAMANIGMFFLITKGGQLFAQKLFETGKIAPKSVRNFLERNKDLYKDRIGKLDFRLDDVLKNPKLMKDYKTYKSIGTTFTTVGCSILASNIITPIVRNNMASKMQNNYIQAKNIEVPQPNFVNYNGSMRI